MRVVAGSLRGQRIAAPRGGATRPTADRVREAVFAQLGDVSGARVLDLYAGSGAYGIEALSRGAEGAVFVDRSAAAARAIRANLDRLGLSGAVHRRAALAWLAAAPAGEAFALVFADPPYDSAPREGRALADRLARVLQPDAVIVTESNKHAPLELPQPLLSERSYGDARIAIHRHVG